MKSFWKCRVYDKSPAFKEFSTGKLRNCVKYEILFYKINFDLFENSFQIGSMSLKIKYLLTFSYEKTVLHETELFC